MFLNGQIEKFTVLQIVCEQDRVAWGSFMSLTWGCKSI